MRRAIQAINDYRKEQGMYKEFNFDNIKIIKTTSTFYDYDIPIPSWFYSMNNTVYKLKEEE